MQVVVVVHVHDLPVLVQFHQLNCLVAAGGAGSHAHRLSGRAAVRLGRRRRQLRYHLLLFLSPSAQHRATQALAKVRQSHHARGKWGKGGGNCPFATL